MTRSQCASAADEEIGLLRPQTRHCRNRHDQVGRDVDLDSPEVGGVDADASRAIRRS